MEPFNTRDFELLEHIPSSSNVLRQKIDNILKNSETWSADVVGMDPTTGRYRIVLQGTLKKPSTAGGED